ncbi:hypothetical protein Bca52824_066787 [Brassica carinata]|uniref:U-box domain-containing protein n=1 Tax=Brassica carinata TaxID=52824 RepID=A0A8X7QMH5_BRACI|nr:hypothetical protein Bca52824_066787 [Brassica carinata]
MDHEEEEIEIPNYFICPISLEIMKDPVTTVSGITYDRQSIVQWLEKVPSCPVTKQPLPVDSDLTPNHMLRRLIQHWCVENATRGVVRIPTPRAPPGKLNIIEEIKNLKSLDKKSSVPMRRRRGEGQSRTKGKLDESLSLLYLIGVPLDEARTILIENDRILESLSLVLNQQDFLNKAYTIVLLRNLTENILSYRIIGFLKDVVSSFNRVDPSVTATVEPSNSKVRNKAPSKLDHSVVIKQAVTAALMILLETSSWSRNRTILVDLAQLARTTELVLGILSRLCCCADGRAQFLAHRCGIAIVTKRLLRVSAAADDRALSILSTVSKYSPESEVVEEMVSVRTVEKLCLVLRTDCSLSLKEKAKEILRDHFDEWKKFPCVDVTLITKLLSSSPKDLLTEYYSRVGV